MHWSLGKGGALIVVVLGAVIVGFNLPAITLDYLIHDDSYMYYLYEAGKIEERISDSASFYPLFPYFEWPLYKLATGLSPDVARWAAVLLYAVPAACGIYLLHRKVWGVDTLTAFYCAVVPFILPFQTRIPTGINISYPLPSLLGMSVLMLISWAAITARKSAKKIYLNIAYLIVLLVTALYSPNAPMILSVVVGLLVCFLAAGHRQALWMIALTIVVIGQRVASALTAQRPSKSIQFAWETTLARVEEFVRNFVLPLPLGSGDGEVLGIGLSTALVLLVALLVTVSVFKFRPIPVACPDHFSRFGRRFLPGVYLLFFLFWAVVTALPYLTIVNTQPQPRYFWFTGFGLAPFVPVAINTVLMRVDSTHRDLLYRSVLVLLVLAIGAMNYRELHECRRQEEGITRKTREVFTGLEFPAGSQVVYITGHHPTHPGISESNLGFLWYAGAPRDVTYAMVFPHRDERYWYDPFKQEPQGWWQPPLSGLDVARPLFIFKEIDGVVQRMPQLLQVVEGSEHWQIYDLDADGGIRLHAQGEGEDRYLAFVSASMGRARLPLAAMIAFGNPDSYRANSVAEQQQAKCDER